MKHEADTEITKRVYDIEAKADTPDSEITQRWQARLEVVEMTVSAVGETTFKLVTNGAGTSVVYLANPRLLAEIILQELGE